MTSKISSGSPLVSLIPVAKSLDSSFLADPLLPLRGSLRLADSTPPLDPHACAHADTEAPRKPRELVRLTLPSALLGSEALTQVPWMDR